MQFAVICFIAADSFFLCSAIGASSLVAAPFDFGGARSGEGVGPGEVGGVGFGRLTRPIPHAEACGHPCVRHPCVQRPRAMRGGRVLGAIGRRGHLCGAAPARAQPRRTAARAAPGDARSEESETSRCSVGFSAAACYTIACRRVETSSLAVAVAFPFPPRVHHGSRLRFPTRPSPLSCATRYRPRIPFPASPPP